MQLFSCHRIFDIKPCMPASARALWIDHLRSAITVLVVAHHSSLAYTTFASFNKQAYILSTHPIVDKERWIGLDIFENFNDVFFMSLMFFISGMFVLPSLTRKGVTAFIRDRFYRLFLPFAAGVTLLMMLAYYPAYYIAHGSHSIKGYVIDYFTTEAWPVGPPWFIWVLFLYNIIFALLFPLLKNKTIGSFRPGVLVSGLVVITWILYVPMAMWVGPYTWTGIGPFDFQKSRILLYFAYFLLGALAGNKRYGDGIFSGKFIALWPLWIAACLLMYILLTVISAPLRQLVAQEKISSMTGWLVYYTVYVLSCSLSCIALVTSFKALVQAPKSWWTFLSANAYSIYLLHYIFVVWCQYALLSISAPAFIKFIITFIVALSGSWIVSHLIRKHPLIRKYL
ncbi:acyltransferase [uncultured Chitinophaga sp.]|jgi:Predicted acyltransferases|uniref:acyltransferase family protein n=1 Tax=uncultured Chitinophaga sp. TaxID=339340 RepID=UPI00262D361C|nr:acyltransferase [uncultured Chitinophaga sp.]